MSKRILTKTIDAAQQTVTFVVKGKEPVVVDAKQLTEDIRTQAMLHGLSQKIGDETAGVEGRTDLAYTKVMDMIDLLQEGDWNRGRAGTGGLLAQALANLTGRELAECTQVLAEKTDDEKKGFRKDPRIAAELAKLQAERAQKAAERATDTGTDLDSLFGA